MTNVSEGFLQFLETDRVSAPVTKFELTDDNRQVIRKLAGVFEPLEWADVNVPVSVQIDIISLMRNDETGLRAVLAKANDAYLNAGVCVLSFGEEFLDQADNEFKKQLVYILSALGQPFGAFNSQGFWHTLGVNPNAQAGRGESNGYIPLHLDFDQASYPPDGLALFCVRPDPRGGGDNIVFDYQSFLSSLSPEDIKGLMQIEQSYSKLFGQNGVGEEFNPHPLLEACGQRDSIFRYNGKIHLGADNPLHKMYSLMEDHFHRASASYRLQAGDMLIVNQSKHLHGREPLGLSVNVSTVDPSEDRFLLQAYLRHRPLCAVGPFTL